MDFSGTIQLAIRAGLAVAGFALIVILLSTIQIPTPDYTTIQQGLSFGVSAIKYFLPGSGSLLNVALAGFGLAITTWGLKFAIIGIKMAFKINQG